MNIFGEGKSAKDDYIIMLLNTLGIKRNQQTIIDSDGLFLCLSIFDINKRRIFWDIWENEFISLCKSNAKGKNLCVSYDEDSSYNGASITVSKDSIKSRNFLDRTEYNIIQNTVNLINSSSIVKLKKFKFSIKICATYGEFSGWLTQSRSDYNKRLLRVCDASVVSKQKILLNQLLEELGFNPEVIRVSKLHGYSKVNIFIGNNYCTYNVKNKYICYYGVESEKVLKSKEYIIIDWLIKLRDNSLGSIPVYSVEWRLSGCGNKLYGESAIAHQNPRMLNYLFMLN